MTTNSVSMQNILNKIEIYRTKSIMIMEAQATVAFNAVTPMVQFKFATRANATSAGDWNNNQNAYWFPSFISLVDAVTQMGTLLKAEAGADNAIAKFSNPKKQKNLMIRKNKADSGDIWYMFMYMSGSEDNNNLLKVNCSCNPVEFNGILGYLKNFLSQYPTIAQMTLVRYDTWYNLVGKHRSNDNGAGAGAGDGSYENNSKPRQQQNNNTGNSNSGGGGFKNTQKPISQSMMDDMNDQFGGDIPPDDDIPF